LARLSDYEVVHTFIHSIVVIEGERARSSDVRRFASWGEWSIPQTGA
jgi:hypothetical protein